MKFRVINSTLIAACEEAGKFLEVVQHMDVVELFSMEGLRTLAQNAKLWPMLTDISKQVIWFNQKHDPETWKHIISAAWRAQVFVQGIGGTLVVLPVRTSKLRKAEFAELIEAIYAFGDEKGVRWSDPALKAYEQYREAA